MINTFCHWSGFLIVAEGRQESMQRLWTLYLALKTRYSRYSQVSQALQRLLDSKLDWKPCEGLKMRRMRTKMSIRITYHKHAAKCPKGPTAIVHANCKIADM